ncbi:MAG: 50S ribosomal protein L30 [Candidatus Schekmanbacteria bacterium]|nr:MAG: 50S ribosomal protein L30 [Candidatus Schekmanbacteria bacterium]
MGKLKITLKKSIIGSSKKQRAIVKGLGLRRTNHSVVRDDNPMIRGMVKKIPHLLSIEEID